MKNLVIAIFSRFRRVYQGGGVTAVIKMVMFKLREFGLLNYLKLVFSQTSDKDIKEAYPRWFKRFGELTPRDRQLIKKGIEDFKHHPEFCLLSAYCGDREAQDLITHLEKQLYGRWRLVLFDVGNNAQNPARFARDNVELLSKENLKTQVRPGEFILPLKKGVKLAPHALYLFAQELNEFPHLKLIYSDHDQVDQAQTHVNPHFKPAWDPFLIHASDYIQHYCFASECVTQAWLEQTLTQSFHAALMTVLAQCQPHDIAHVPFVLFHATAQPAAVSSADQCLFEDANAIENPLNPQFSRLKFEAPTHTPKVSLIIPTRDRLDLLETCVTSLKKTTYPNYELIILDNGSVAPETLAYFEKLKQSAQVEVIRVDAPFNWSALNNCGVRHAKGELLCFLNNDIEVIDGEWLRELVSLAVQPEVGAVGARLLYPNETVQHAGVVLGIGGRAGHCEKHLPQDEPGYQGQCQVVRTMSAVTGACLMIRKTVFEQVGGFDETLAVAFNDVDFCIRVLKAGYRNVWTPFATLIHHESVSRGYDTTLEKQALHVKEAGYLVAQHPGYFDVDPYFNPNFSYDSETIQLSPAPRVQKPWLTH